MTEHNIGPNSSVLGFYTDGTPRIRAGAWFYKMNPSSWTVAGGRFYVHPSMPATATKARLSVYHRTAGMPTSNDLPFGSPLESKVVPITGPGWYDVHWDTPFTFNPAASGNFIFIGVEYLTASDGFTGYYTAGNLPTEAQQSPTLGGMFLAENAIRGQYSTEATEVGTGPVNSTWYGTDIIIDDVAVTTGNTIRAFENMVGTDFSSNREGGVVYNLATEFYVTRQAWLTEIRVMMPNSGSGTLGQRYVSLWDVDGPSSGTEEVGLVAFTPAGFSQWATVVLPTPYPLVAMKRYRAVCRLDANDGYVAKPSFFSGSTDYSNDYLIVPRAGDVAGGKQGSFTVAGNAFPDQSFNSAFYGIDVGVVDTIDEPSADPEGSAAFSHKWTISATGVTPRFLSVKEENLKAGESSANITIGGAGDLTNLGYARQLSVDSGQTVDFSCTGAGTVIDIYRIGYYGNAQWHKVTTITNTATTQPVPNTQGPEVNGGYEASNWSTTASWAVPKYALSGLYVGVYRSNPGPNASYIPFIVRNDARKAKIVYKVSETTWGGAYNNFGTVVAPLGGKNLYGMNTGVGQITDRTHFVSFMRPIVTRDSVAQTYWMACELPLITWLERNGYDVKYVTGVDLDRDPTILNDANIFISSGHDEYWSDQMRKTVEDWRLNSTVSQPTHCLFMSGNEVFWRIRFNAARTGFYCYKDTMTGPGAHVAGTPLDPVSWTGTWKDTRWSGSRPEWYTTGQDFRMNGVVDLPVTISRAAYGSHPVWANTALTSGDVTFPQAIGFEADQIHPTQPSDAVVVLASSTIPINGRYADNNGENYSGNGSLAPWGIVAQRFGVKSVTVGFGTCQWSWLLSDKHDRFSTSAESLNAKQFMVNLLGDLEVQPDGLEAGLAARTPVSLDYYGLDTPPEGAAQFTHNWALATTGKTIKRGAAQLSYTFAVNSAGVVTKRGASALAHDWTVSVQGRTPQIAVPMGSAVFTHNWAVSAAGDTLEDGAVQFTHAWVVSAAGVVTKRGSAGLSHQWTVSVQGRTPPIPVPVGSAQFQHSWNVAVAGDTPPVGMNYGAAAFSYRFQTAAKGINGQGLRSSSAIHMQISTYARDHIRQRATDLMNCRVRITRAGTSYDPVTRRDVNTDGQLLYEGPARVWEVPAGQNIIIGDDEVTVTSTYLSLPFWVYPLPEDDDLIVVLDSDDPDLTGRSLNVESTVRGGGLRASRRFQVTVSTSKKSTW